MNPVKTLLTEQWPGKPDHLLLTASAAAGRVPELWLQLLEANTQSQLKTLLRELWKPVYRHLFQLMYRNLVADCLQGFAVLAEDGEPPSLLYLFTRKGRLELYRGELPLAEQRLPEKWQAVWPALPATFRALYQVHNGWTSYDLWGSKAGTLGHLPIDYWWWVNEEIPCLELRGEEGITWDNLLITFQDVGGNRMGFELVEDEAGGYTAYDIRWYKGESPTMTDFIEKYDSWITDSFFNSYKEVDPSRLPE